jgi:hypothetical protein
MKYAVCFRGIHYLDPIKTYQSVDYTNSYNNNKEFLLDEINSSYDIFIWVRVLLVTLFYTSVS